MEGPINFTQDNRKEVFDFFASLLRNYQEPIYYEYIRGHVSKASSVVRKYVASKCKGEKLLEYFKVRKNYFIVEGTDVQLIKDSGLRRRRVQSECAAEVTRERKKGNTKRSSSVSSAISENTIASSSASYNNEEKLEHEDYVNKYFSDLVARYDKVLLSSLDYDNLPKKVKRHLDLYYKKKVKNYFDKFPDKYSSDKEGYVSFKISAPYDSPIPLESSSVDIMIPSNSADTSLPTTNITIKANIPIDHEVQYRYSSVEAITFFTDILIKKKTSLTVDQLGGYLSQAPKELRTFLKLNFNMLKNFFEEYSVIFLFNDYGEVTLSKSIRNSRLIIEKMKRIVSKALSGTLPVETMKAKLDCILHPIELSEMELCPYNGNGYELAESFNEATIEDQPNVCLTLASSKVISELNCEVQNYSKETEENVSVTFVETTSKCSEDTNGQTDVKVNSNSNTESKMNEISINESSVILSERKLLEFFSTFELLCLEMAEQDFEFTVINNLNAILYFKELLSEPLLKDWSLNRLRGTIGKASAEVSSFLNKKYKGDKFESFFQGKAEFIVDGPFVKLSPSYQEKFSERLTTLSVYANQNSKWDLLKLYESKCFKEICNEVSALFHDICSFLENKSKTKLSRLEGIVTRFPTCLEWIKALDGTTLAKKIGHFLCLFSIFDIFDEDCIYFSEKGSCDNILYFFEKVNQNKKIDFQSLLPGLFALSGSDSVQRKSCTNTFELSKDSCYLLEKTIKDKIPIRYCEIVKILPTPLLLEIYNSGIGTKIIIDTMLKTDKFFLQKGKIDLKSEQNMSFCSENGIDNSLVSNEFKTRIANFMTKEKDALKCSTGSNTISVQTDEAYYVHCNDCNNVSLFEGNLENVCDGSCTLKKITVEDGWETSFHIPQSSTPVKMFSDSKDCNKIPLVLPNPELAKCNSLNLDSKGDIEIESKESECNSEDYDSLVSEIDSVTSRCETHSFSSLEDELTSINEENMNTSNANGIIAEISCLEDACASSQQLNCYDETKLLSEDIKVEEINASTPTIVQYIDLLNGGNELPDTNENDSAETKLFNDPEIGSQILPTNDFNLYQTKAKSPSKQNISSILNSDENEIGYLKETGCKIDGHESENIAEMKNKAQLLAKEVFQNNFHNIQQSKIFVACTSVIFLFKKNYLSKTYGSLSSKKDISKNVSKTVPINNTNSLNNLKLTENESLNNSSDILTAVTLPDLTHPMKNSCPLEIKLSNCKDTLVEYPLKQVFDSTNKIKETSKLSPINGEDIHGNTPLPEKIDSTNSSTSNINLSSNYSEPDLSEHPLQPIFAEVVLLTADSCIAVAKIESRKQNIYFLKCVFVCDHQYCCSDCFNDLKVSDTVSCFVPPTEMSRKMWIAIMVSKESSTQFEEMDSFNEVLRKQKEGGCMNRNMCVNSKSVSIQTEHPCLEFGCQTESSSTEEACQTYLCGDVKLCAITENSTSQTNVSVKSTAIQTANETKSSECQTNFSLDQFNVESQTHHTGDIKESSTCADVLCQTDLPEDVQLSINVVNTECQTISTGQVMITKYYHM